MNYINFYFQEQLKLILVHKKSLINLFVNKKVELEFVDDFQSNTNSIKLFMLTQFNGIESNINMNKALKFNQNLNRNFAVKNQIKDKLTALLKELYDEKLTLKEELMMPDAESSDRNLLQDDKSIIFQCN